MRRGTPRLLTTVVWEVDALENRPGVYSARYAGVGSTDQENNEFLLKELAGVPLDKRRLASVACLLWQLRVRMG